MPLKLVSVIDVKKFLSKEDNEDNILINTFIEKTTADFESHCRRSFEKKRYTENYTSDGIGISLKEYPVSDLNTDTFSLIIAGTKYTRDTEFVLDNKSGIIAFPFDVSPVSVSNGDASINYTSGYVVKNAAPVLPVESMGLTFDTTIPITYEDKPGTFLATDLSVAGNVNGVVSYKMTFATDTDETEMSSFSSGAETTTITNSQVGLSLLPVIPALSVATKRNIYRTKANGTDYYYIGSISNNATTTFTDNVADASLLIEYYSRANYTFYDGSNVRAILGTDYTRSSTGFENIGVRPLIIKQQSDFLTINENYLKDFTAKFSGECLFGLIDTSGNIYSLGKANIFSPDDTAATWVNRSTLTPTLATEYYLTREQFSNKIEYFPTQAKRRKFGIVVVIPPGSEGKINSATFNLTAQEWITTADDDTTLVPEDLKKACIEQTAFEFKYRKELGLSGRTDPDGTILFSRTKTNFLPSVLKILSKYKRQLSCGY